MNLAGRLAAGLAGHGLEPDEATLDRLLELVARIVEGNDRQSLVATDDPAELVDRHIVDSAAFAPWLGSARRAVDVGTGAGLPGLVLAALDPGRRWTLVESRGRKADFVRRTADRLGLAGVEVATGRAEDLGRDPAHREVHDAAVARAVAGLSVLAELLLPLVAVGGVALLAKGPDPAAEVAAAAGAIATLGGGPAVVRPYRPGPFTMVRIEKIAPTPAAYPRRPGRPSRRPLT